MPGTRIFTISLLLFTAAFAQQPDYFPLHPGNQWVYRCNGACGDPAPVLEVVKYGQFNGRWYSLVKGFGGREAWLRQDKDGVLWQYDPTVDAELQWYRFFAPEGEAWDTLVDPCSTRASVISRSAEYKGPVGSFTWALRIGFVPGRCADAGLTEEYFLPWVGLVHRSEQTIAGPRRYDLIYSRTGGVTYVTEPHLTFSVTLDRSAYVANLMPPIPDVGPPQLLARLTLRNTTPDPVRLDFPTSQRYDLEIRNEAGEAVYRWSDGKGFLDVIGQEEFGPGERNYTVLAPLSGKDGSALEPGRYTVEVWLATGRQRMFAALVAFEMRWVL